jgi:hypothetical protein
MNSLQIESASLMLVTAVHGTGTSLSDVAIPPPGLTVISFPTADQAEAARKQLEAKKIDGLTVIPLYGNS